jgi:class 3 adenylate cyclase/hemoglobin-like flavoprotein
MATVHYSGINQHVECEAGDSTLLEISMSNQIPHLHECGGNGRCTTCRVRVLDGHKNLSAPSRLERELARLRRWDPSIRLACQAFVEGDISVQKLVWTSAEVSKLQLETVPEGEAESRAIAILFCDLRNFTNISSYNNVYDMAHMLNRFYTMLSEPILMNNGVIYQYVGDEIVGIFGTNGGTKSQNCLDALRAALGMQYAVRRLNRMELKDFDTEFKVGIGINFGRAYLGYLGHPKHRQFAVVGDPVNVASRIQGCTKDVGAGILVSDDLFKNLPANDIAVGSSHSLEVKGKDEPLLLHEIEGFSEMDMTLELQSTLDIILSDDEAFAMRFYEKLFAVAPQVRSLFKGDMNAQGRMLTHMLVGIVYSLSRPDHLTMGLRTLGKSHERYGVRPEYYPAVVDVLIETIREQLGELCTEKVERAWRQALEFVTKTMMNWAA